MTYKYETMSWWSIITTQGRLLQDICVDFTEGTLRVTRPLLENGEDIAILIDRMRNQATLYVSHEECQKLARLHYYELFIQDDQIERFLATLEPQGEEQ